MRFYVVLLLLCVAKLAAGACTNGVQLVNNGQCVCPSGYTGAACDILTNCVGSVAGATQADHFPVLDYAAASYTQNTLRVSVLGDYVLGRQYTGIHFVNQTLDSCGMGSENSFWLTRAAGCQDEFHIDMPWHNHTACGFKINQQYDYSADDSENMDNQTAVAEDHYVSYAAKFTLFYVDFLGSIENVTLNRTTSVPYQIYVRFPTRLDISLSNVQVTSIVEMGIALTGDSFDPDTQQLTMEITVINSWPNMLDFVGDAWSILTPQPHVTHMVWNDVASSTTNGVTYADHTCTSDEGSVCKQSFQFTFSTSTCTFDGQYNFTVGLYTCRGDFYLSCTTDLFVLSFDLDTSSVCQNITVSPPLGGSLVPFHTMDKTAYINNAEVMPFHESAAAGFNIGSYGYFQIQLNAATSVNTIALEYYEISFQDNLGGARRYLMKDGIVRNNNESYIQPGTVLEDAYHYDEAKLEIYNPAKGFQVYFSSVVFKVMPTMYTVYTFRASAYATYLGNEGETKKRSVEFVFEAPSNQMSAWTQVQLASSEAINSDIRNQDSSDLSNLGYILGGAGAGLVLIVMSVVGIAIHQKRQAAKRLLDNAL